MRIAVADGAPRSRGALQSVSGAGELAALERIAAYVVSERRGLKPAWRCEAAEGAGRRERAPADRAPLCVGGALGARRRADRGRRRAAAGRAIGPLPPDELGARRRRGGGRARGLSRPRLPRPRLLGQRRVRAAVPCRHAPGRRPGDARVPDQAPAGRPSRRPRGGRRGARFPWESAAQRRGRDPRTAPRPSRARGGDLHRRARGAHRRRRRLGRGLLRRLDRR